MLVVKMQESYLETILKKFNTPDPFNSDSIQVWNVYGDLHSEVYKSLLETRNYVSGHNSDIGTLNASSCIILICQNGHTANSKLGFMKIHTLNGGWCIYQAFLPYSTPCRPATQVSKADSKGQIIWPYISTMVLILPHTQMIQNALL